MTINTKHICASQSPSIYNKSTKMNFKKMTNKSVDKKIKKSVNELKMVKVTYTFPVHTSYSIEDVLTEMFNISEQSNLDTIIKLEESEVTESDIENFLKTNKNWTVVEPNTQEEDKLKDYLPNKKSYK